MDKALTALGSIINWIAWTRPDIRRRLGLSIIDIWRFLGMGSRRKCFIGSLAGARGCLTLPATVVQA